jgi:hypothetical protein
MVSILDQEFDEEAAMQAAWESLAAPHPRDVIKREHERELRGHPRDVALEKWRPELETMMMHVWSDRTFSAVGLLPASRLASD